MKDDSIKLISLIRHTLAKDCGEGGKERKRVDSAHCANLVFDSQSAVNKSKVD